MLKPYHRFGNCVRLRSEIKRIRGLGGIDADTLVKHQMYHYSLFQKLLSACRNIDALKTTLSSEFAGRGEGDMSLLLSQANMHIDSFFYFGGSSLDILAREILVYFGIALPQNVYFTTARDEMTRIRPGDPIIPRFLQDPPWKDEFSRYRNSATHELLLVDRIDIRLKHIGGDVRKEVILPLPDDPRVPQLDRTYERNKDVIVYCETQVKRIISLVNQIYGEIAERIHTNNLLPIP